MPDQDTAAQAGPRVRSWPEAVDRTLMTWPCQTCGKEIKPGSQATRHFPGIYWTHAKCWRPGDQTPKGVPSIEDRPNQPASPDPVG